MASYESRKFPKAWLRKHNLRCVTEKWRYIMWKNRHNSVTYPVRPSIYLQYICFLIQHHLFAAIYFIIWKINLQLTIVGACKAYGKFGFAFLFPRKFIKIIYYVFVVFVLARLHCLVIRELIIMSLPKLVSWWRRDCSWLLTSGQLFRHFYSVLRPRQTTPEKFENPALFLQLDLPCTQIRHENGAFRNRSSKRRNLKTPALRFSVDGKHFENAAFEKRRHHENHVILLIEFSSNKNARSLFRFQISPAQCGRGVKEYNSVNLLSATQLLLVKKHTAIFKF